jgi:hypothetical protein
LKIFLVDFSTRATAFRVFAGTRGCWAGSPFRSWEYPTRHDRRGLVNHPQQGAGMKTLLSLAVAAVTALSFASAARADESQTTKIESKKEMGKNGAKESVQAETKTDPGGMLNSTKDSTKVERSSKDLANGGTRDVAEKTEKHSPPGLKASKTHHTKQTVERDANGNVVKEKLDKK